MLNTFFNWNLCVYKKNFLKITPMNFRFWTCLGNIACIFVFNHKSVDLKPSFANLLKCLSVYDVIFLVRFSLSFLFWWKIIFIFRCHFSVKIFFKLFPAISFAYSKVKPSKLRNFLIFFPFCLLSTCQVWYFRSLPLWHAIPHESCSRVFLIHSQSFHFFHLKGQCHKIFCFRFFSWITFPQAPDNNIRIISSSRCTTVVVDTGDI